MGLFGFGKKKEKDNVDKMVQDFSKNFSEAVDNADFNALLRQEKEKQKASVRTELTEENLLKFLSENSGEKVTMSTKLGSIYDYTDPLTDIFLQGDLENKFGVHLNAEFDEDTTVAQVMRAMKG